MDSYKDNYYILTLGTSMNRYVNNINFEGTMLVYDKYELMSRDEVFGIIQV